MKTKAEHCMLVSLGKPHLDGDLERIRDAIEEFTKDYGDYTRSRQESRIFLEQQQRWPASQKNFG